MLIKAGVDTPHALRYPGPVEEEEMRLIAAGMLPDEARTEAVKRIGKRRRMTHAQKRGGW